MIGFWVFEGFALLFLVAFDVESEETLLMSKEFLNSEKLLKHEGFLKFEGLLRSEEFLRLFQWEDLEYVGYCAKLGRKGCWKCRIKSKEIDVATMEKHDRRLASAKATWHLAVVSRTLYSTNNNIRPSIVQIVAFFESKILAETTAISRAFFRTRTGWNLETLPG